jgi:hypothetical protein
MNLHRALVVGMGIAGVVLTQFMTYRTLPLAEVFRWENWQSAWIEGATAGALLGHLVWVIAKPRQRVSRAVAVCTIANVIVWLSFLAITPELPASEFRRIDAERAKRDADSGLDLITDQPIVVAGRWHGTFGAFTAADRLLTLFAAPAIAFSAMLIVPVRYIGIDATKRESVAIAGLGFVLSTAFWTAVGGTASGLRRKSRARAGGLN